MNGEVDNPTYPDVEYPTKFRVDDLNGIEILPQL